MPEFLETDLANIAAVEDPGSVLFMATHHYLTTTDLRVRRIVLIGIELVGGGGRNRTDE